MQKTAFSYVRYSSPPQADGHSEERQTEAADDYAAKMGFHLDTDTRMVDRKSSAWKGKNIEPTAVFGRFLNDVESGRIPKGSVLIVEELDRITRLPPLKGITLFTSLLNAGIEIHTLKNGKILTAESLNKDQGDLLLCVLALCSAHAESEQKSDRVRKAWRKLKANAANDNPITARLPYWLEIKDGKIVKIPERAEVVRQIFDARLNGKGKFLIAKELNSKPVEPWGTKSKQWIPSYVYKILTNRAVLGEYQPHETIGGKRFPVKNGLVKDYYPQIIDRNDFNLAQEKLRAGRLGGTGKHNGGVSNLFTGLVFCSYTTLPMFFTNKKCGTSWQYLTDGKGNVWNYNDFEKRFFDLVKEVNWGKLVNRERAKGSAELQENIERLLREKEDLDARAKRIAAAIEEGLTLSEISQRATELKEQRANNKRDLDAAILKRDNANVAALTTEEMEEGFLGNPEKRIKVKGEIRRHIQSIWVSPREKEFTVYFISGHSLNYGVKEGRGVDDWEALDAYIGWSPSQGLPDPPTGYPKAKHAS